MLRDSERLFFVCSKLRPTSATQSVLWVHSLGDSLYVECDLMAAAPIAQLQTVGYKSCHLIIKSASARFSSFKIRWRRLCKNTHWWPAVYSTAVYSQCKRLTTLNVLCHPPKNKWKSWPHRFVLAINLTDGSRTTSRVSWTVVLISLINLREFALIYRYNSIRKLKTFRLFFRGMRGIQWTARQGGVVQLRAGAGA